MNLVVDSNWLESKLEDPDVIIIDSRGSMLYRLGHIKNSIPVGVEQVVSISDNGSNLILNIHDARSLFYQLGIHSSKTVVVYGEYLDPSAARIFWTLNYYGYSNVKLLDVGYNQWKRLGLSITKQMEDVIKKDTAHNDDVENVGFNPKVVDSIRADAQMIKEKQSDPNVLIVDARTPEEHFQARIPGSILDNWEDGLGDYGKIIQNKERLQHIFEKKGITKDKEIICYCHAGMRASHKYVQLKYAGYNNVRVYDGSIIDWAQRGNPIR